MASPRTNSRIACLSLLFFATFAGCSAGPSGSEKPGGGKDKSDWLNDNGLSDDLHDVDFVEVEAPFWQPPAFVGDACEGTKRGKWGDALQMALFFFNVNRSGPGLTHKTLQWRGDSHVEDGHIKLSATDPNGTDMSAKYIEKWRHVLDPDGNGELDMAGGYYDAGDFLKIGITQNFMASTLGWSMWEFPESFSDTGLAPKAREALRWFADFAMKNTFIANPDEIDPWKWNVVAYGHQVGGASDHDCGWMPPELRRTKTCPRKGYFATHEQPLADVTAGAAAALAITGWHHRLVDPAYATKCLNHAIALYEFAKKYPGTSWPAEGLYQSEDGYDDLSWAAIWLHETLPEKNQAGGNELTNLYASHKAAYLDDIVREDGTGWLENFRNGSGPKISCIKDGGSCWAESWTHCWNSVRSGIFVKLAEILQRTGNKHMALKKGILDIARVDSLAWIKGPHTEGGFAKKVDVSWGSARYNAGGQLTALAFAKIFPDDVITKDDVGGTKEEQKLIGRKTAEVFSEWAKGQTEYLLGDNPLGQSYVMGYSENYASSAHHAATHASIYGLCEKPEESKHIAYGALVSGPNSGDNHSDDRCDYGSNEITIDYNAALLGALAGNYAFHGRGECPDPNFPPPEPPADEFFTKSQVNLVNDCTSQVMIQLVNETSQPPRFERNLSVRYYVDVTELREKGIDPEKLRGTIMYQNYGEEKVDLSGLQPCTLNTNTYYFEIAVPYDFWGEQVWLKGPREFLLEVGVGNGPGCVFDEKNDWSFAGLTETMNKSPAVPVYLKGELIWGAEPECHEPPKIIVPPPIVR